MYNELSDSEIRMHVQNSGIIRYLTLSSFPFSFKASSDVITDEGLKLDQQQHSSSIIILMLITILQYSCTKYIIHVHAPHGMISLLK